MKFRMKLTVESVMEVDTEWYPGAKTPEEAMEMQRQVFVKDSGLVAETMLHDSLTFDWKIEKMPMPEGS